MQLFAEHCGLMGVQTRTLVDLAGHHPSTRLSEKPYLKVTRQIVVEQGTWIQRTGKNNRN